MALFQEGVIVIVICRGEIQNERGHRLGTRFFVYFKKEEQAHEMLKRLQERGVSVTSPRDMSPSEVSSEAIIENVATINKIRPVSYTLAHRRPPSILKKTTSEVHSDLAPCDLEAGPMSSYQQRKVAPPKKVVTIATSPRDDAVGVTPAIYETTSDGSFLDENMLPTSTRGPSSSLLCTSVLSGDQLRPGGSEDTSGKSLEPASDHCIRDAELKMAESEVRTCAAHISAVRVMSLLPLWYTPAS